MDHMTIEPSGRIPQFTQGDRLRKARSLTGLNTRDFADLIGVSHGTVTNAEGDKREVRRITLNAWSFATGVPLEWLENGGTGPMPTPPGVPKDELTALTERKMSRHRNSSPSSTPRYAAYACAA